MYTLTISNKKSRQHRVEDVSATCLRSHLLYWWALNKNSIGTQPPHSSAVQIFAKPIRRKVGGGAKAGYFWQRDYFEPGILESCSSWAVVKTWSQVFGAYWPGREASVIIGTRHFQNEAPRVHSLTCESHLRRNRRAGERPPAVGRCLRSLTCLTVIN